MVLVVLVVLVVLAACVVLAVLVGLVILGLFWWCLRVLGVWVIARCSQCSGGCSVFWGVLRSSCG